MAHYKVKALHISGIGKKMYHSGDNVTDKDFPEGKAEELLENGYLEEAGKESKPKSKGKGSGKSDGKVDAKDGDGKVDAKDGDGKVDAKDDDGKVDAKDGDGKATK